MTKMAAKWLKSIANLRPKRLKNHALWGCTYLYSPYKGLPPPPREYSFVIFEVNQEDLSETKTVSTKRNVDTRVLLFGCERPDPSSNKSSQIHLTTGWSWAEEKSAFITKQSSPSFGKSWRKRFQSSA